MSGPHICTLCKNCDCAYRQLIAAPGFSGGCRRDRCLSRANLERALRRCRMKRWKAWPAQCLFVLVQWRSRPNMHLKRIYSVFFFGIYITFSDHYVIQKYTRPNLSRFLSSVENIVLSPRSEAHAAVIAWRSTVRRLDVVPFLLCDKISIV